MQQLVRTPKRSYYFEHEEKFSTISFEFVFSSIMKVNEIEARNVVAQVLAQATKDFSSKIETRSYFADLYAAQVHSGANKSGAEHEIIFQFSFVHPSKVQDDNYTFETIFECVEKILFHPALVDGAFLPNIVEVEKRLIVDRIKHLYDNKTQYAQIRLTEEMFKDTPLALKSYGEIENYQPLTPEEITSCYQSMLENDHVSIYVVGNFDETLLSQNLDRLFESVQDDTIREEAPVHTRIKRAEVLEVSEQQQVSQTKLHIGYHAPIQLVLPEYVIAQVTTTILGGGAQSKLFQNVREKASLAYYVSAGLDTFAEVMYVYAGIELAQKAQTIDIINAQILDMQNGNITVDELEMAKEQIIHGLVASLDNPYSIVRLQKVMARVEQLDTVEQWINVIEQVTLSDVINYAKLWELDTIYTLAPINKEGGEIDAD